MKCLFYGSDYGSSDSGDEGTTLPFTRVFLANLDTPIDEVQEPAADEDVKPPADLPSTGQTPNDLFDFRWVDYPENPIPASIRREPFTQTNIGPTEPCLDPYLIFVSIWDASIMEHIVKQTNKYAQEYAQKLRMNNKLTLKSRICSWVDTDADELYTYFAIIMAMGVVIKSKIEDYWPSKSNIFVTPVFRAHMTLARFQLLNTCLHFIDNEAMLCQQLEPAEARLCKIKPIIDHLNSKFQSMYTLSQNIALDGSVVRYRHMPSMNNVISNKAAKVRVKTYEVCEPQSGYLWRFEVHGQKRSSPLDPQNPLSGSTPTIVLNLLNGLEGKGYTVWMNNFYNSPALARKLKVLGFDVAGTLCTSRQYVPTELKMLAKSAMREGQIAGLTSGDVDILVWRDENRVAMISTYHGNITAVSKGKIKPCLILDYNIMMGGVDKKDELLSGFPIERKRTRVWYKNFFKKLFSYSVLNAFVICKQSGSSLDHRNFRETLISSILIRHSKPKPRNPIALPHNNSGFYDARVHHILEYEIGKNGSRLRRKCVICKKLTHFYCAGCEKSSCIATCFVALHSS